MKIAFIHLSDFHFKDREDSLARMAKAAVRAVHASVGADPVHPVIVLTGDLAYAGKKNEYESIRDLIDSLLDAAREEFGCGAPIPIAMVPGNHDVVEPWKTVADLKEALGWLHNVKTKFYEQELESSEHYLGFASTYGVDVDRKSGTYVKSFGFKEGSEEVEIRLVMLSSSPYSTLDKELEMHYLPDSALQAVRSSAEPGSLSPYTAVLMHHPEHWYNEKVRLDLRNVLQQNVDFLFTGHEHMEDLLVEDADGNTHLVVSRAGEFARDDWQRCTFSCAMLDTSRHSATVWLYQWDPTPNARLYVQKQERTVDNVVYPKGAALHPSNEYLSSILKADEPFFGRTFLDYYQLPCVRLSESISEKAIERQGGFNARVLGERELFERIAASRVINVVGDKNSGRTTFVKYLYLKCLERGYSPVMLGKNTVRGRFASSFEYAIRDQYGRSDAMFDAFRQQSDTRKILFIDDFYTLSNKERSVFFDESVKAAGTAVFVSDQPLILDKSGCADKAVVLGSEMSTLRLGQFTKSSRDALIRKVCSAKGIPETMSDDIASAITRTVTEYHYMFPLNPGFTLQYLRFALDKNDAGEVLLRCEKPFGEVYRGNIERILSTHGSTRRVSYSPTDWNRIAIDCLGRIAYSMHASREGSIAAESMLSVIKAHLEEYGIVGLEPKEVFSSLRESGIIELDDDGKCGFANSNHYAFFVAHDITRRLDYTVYEGVVDKGAREDVIQIIDEVMYGINETILVFLSYLRASAFIPREFGTRAVSVLSDVEPAVDLAFAYPQDQVSQDQVVMRMPDDSDRKHFNIEYDRIEEVQARNHAPRRDLYTYKAKELDSPQMVIPTATKYLELAGRSLSACFVSTRLADKESIIEQMYDSLGRLMGQMTDLFGDSFDDVVDSVVRQVTDGDQDEAAERKQVSLMYTGLLIGFAVGLVEQIADGMPDDKVIDCVCSRKANTRVERLFQLALLSNHSDRERFCDYAGKTCKDARDHGKKADELATALVVSQYIIQHSSLRKNLMDKLADQVFNGNRRKVRNKLMMDRAKSSL